MLITIIFIVGFTSLFIINPNTFEEINNVSIAAYNLVGMNGRPWAIIIYLTTGLLSIIFCLGLSGLKKSTIVNRLGKALVITTGLLWASFGFIPYQFENDFGTHLFLIRILLMILLGSIGLIILGSEYIDHPRGGSRLTRLYTLSTGLLMLAISALSVFVYNDKTWIRTNISFTVYFIWFGLVGLQYLKNASKSEQQKESSSGGSLL